MITPNLWMMPVFGLAGAAAVRVLTAPYFVWRDARLAADAAEARLADPDFAVKERMTRYIGDCYSDFADNLGSLCTALHAKRQIDSDKARRFGELTLILAFDDPLNDLVTDFRNALEVQKDDAALIVAQKMLDHIRSIGH